MLARCMWYFQVARLHKTVERSRSGPPSKSPPPLPEEDDADDYSKLNEWEEERPPGMFCQSILIY